MSNSFNISVAPEIAALDAKIDILDTEVDAIRSLNLPAILTLIGTVDTEVGVIDGIVDAIKVKTDALPQVVRGHFTIYHIDTSSGSFVDLCNISGQGHLIYISVYANNALDTVEVKFIIDGIPSLTFSHGGDTVMHRIIYLDADNTANQFAIGGVPYASDGSYLLSTDFDTSLVVQIRRSAGAAVSVIGKVAVCVDSF